MLSGRDARPDERWWCIANCIDITSSAQGSFRTEDFSQLVFRRAIYMCPPLSRKHERLINHQWVFNESAEGTTANTEQPRFNSSSRIDFATKKIEACRPLPPWFFLGLFLLQLVDEYLVGMTRHHARITLRKQRQNTTHNENKH